MLYVYIDNIHALSECIKFYLYKIYKQVEKRARKTVKLSKNSRNKYRFHSFLWCPL
jgi:hypothetical protein